MERKQDGFDDAAEYEVINRRSVVTLRKEEFRRVRVCLRRLR